MDCRAYTRINERSLSQLSKRCIATEQQTRDVSSLAQRFCICHQMAVVLREWQWGRVFAFLGLPDLGRVRRVCALWHRSASDRLVSDLLETPVLFAAINVTEFYGVQTSLPQYTLMFSPDRIQDQRSRREQTSLAHTPTFSPEQPSCRGHFLLCPSPKSLVS